MARFKRLDVLQAMVQSGLVPVFYHQDLEVAKKVAEAVARGGARVLEFTNRGEFAYTVFSELVQWGTAEASRAHPWGGFCSRSWNRRVVCEQRREFHCRTGAQP